jgi:hypothetical protein
MQVSKIPIGLLHALNEATRGKLKEIQDYCQSRQFELDVSCMTYLNGLPGQEMKLYVTATSEGGTELFIQAPLEGSARVLGWNLYLNEKAQAVRENVRKAVEKIEALG